MGHCRDEQILLFGFPEQLWDDLDLLSPRLEVRQRDTRHSGHLHVVDHAHQLIEQPDGQVGVLETVDGQTSPCLLVSVLQVCDDAVVNVFFLLLDIIFIGILSDVLDSGKRFIRRIFVLQYLYKNKDFEMELKLISL